MDGKNEGFLKQVKGASKKLGGTLMGSVIGTILAFLSNAILLFAKMIPAGFATKLVGAVAWLIIYFEPELQEQVARTETDIDDLVLSELVEAAKELLPVAGQSPSTDTGGPG